MKQDDFVRMKVLELGIHKLDALRDDLKHAMDRIVLAYLAKNSTTYPIVSSPQRTSAVNINYHLKEEGIEVWYFYTASRIGCLDDSDEPTKYTARYNLTYFDVFGWPLPSKVPIKEAYDMLNREIDSVRPKPPPINFEI